MAGKLKKVLRHARKEGKHYRIAVEELDMGPISIDSKYRERFSIPLKEIKNPVRKPIYKKELLSLAKHGRRTEGKTIYFAHPLQTMPSGKSPSRGQRRGAGGFVSGSFHSLVESDPLHRNVDISDQRSRQAAMREIIKARRYSKLVKKFTKKAGPLGLAVSAFDVLGKKE